MKLPHRHAHGTLATKNERLKKAKARVRRWAKRVLKRLAAKDVRDV